MNPLDNILNKLRDKIINFESDVYSAKREGLEDNPVLVDTMVAILIESLLSGECEYIPGVQMDDIFSSVMMANLEYDAMVRMDSQHGSQEF